MQTADASRPDLSHEEGARPVRPASALDRLGFSSPPLNGDVFTTSQVARGLSLYRAGRVRLIKANVGDPIAVVFGMVEDDDEATGTRDQVEVSVMVSAEGDGPPHIDGRSTGRQGSQKNCERVVALLLAAQAEHGGEAAAREVAALEASVPDRRTLRLLRRDLRAGILGWGEGDGQAAPLADMRLATTADPDPELAALLRDSGLRPVEELYSFDEIDPAAHGAYASPAPDAAGQERDWAEFLANRQAEIAAAGTQVEVDPSFGLELVEGTDGRGTLHDEGDEDSMDWFGFEYGVGLGEERVNIVPGLVEYLRSRPPGFSLTQLQTKPAGYKIPVRAKAAGQFVALDAGRLHGVLEMLGELLTGAEVDGATGRLRIHRLGAAQLAASRRGRALLGPAPERLAGAAAAIETLKPQAAAEVPAGFLAQLRPYQQDGFEWLQFLREQGLGGILADDMGLGKTVQTLCHLHREKESGRADRPTLIVAPKSVAPGWENEARKFAPSLTVLRLEGRGRKRYYPVLEHVDLVVTSYPVLLRDAEELLEKQFHYVVLDEAHTIKNSSAQISKVAYRLDSRHRLALSGTPLENHLGELWSLFHFLMPGFLGDEPGFTQNYRVPIEKLRDEARMAALAERVRPLMLRRSKDLVARDLPPKTEIVRQVELSPGQVDLYEAVRASLSRDLNEEIDRRGLPAAKILILDALMKLRQVCCHPALLKLPAAQKVRSSAKLEMLMEMLPPMVEGGRRILVFSQFTSMLGLIEAELEGAGIPYLTLTGASRDRGALCAKFQSGEVPVFLISLRAGGTGITLTAADTVIHYDPWWNPALEAQATDRAHRIGQGDPVFVYKLISRGTIEEKIVMLQHKKRALFEGLLEGAAQRLEFSEADLDDLLAPIDGAGRRP